jgi:hypothetical protein
VKRLMAEFVPAADEVHSLQTRKDPEGLLFQKIAEQGHYAGRVQPTNTRQGTYAAAPSGVLLGSINSNDPKRMADMLRQALAKWRSLPEPDKWLEGSLRPTPGRPEFHYPADGLVLRQTVRDLPRQNPPPDWRGTAWNKDYAWFRKEEARSLLPAELRAGSTQDVPRPLLVRLGRFNLMDTVRGQSFQYPANAIQRAELTARVERVVGDRVEVRLNGQMRAEQTGRWPIAGYRDMHSPSDQKRGYDLDLEGEAVWDRSKEKFTKFELVAAGSRWGATQYNGRSDDLGPAPIGYLFQLASDQPHDKVPPSEFHSYGWR